MKSELFTAEFVLTMFPKYRSGNVCCGQPVLVPSGAVLRVIGGGKARVFCCADYAGEILFGWFDRADLQSI